MSWVFSHLGKRGRLLESVKKNDVQNVYCMLAGGAEVPSDDDVPPVFKQELVSWAVELNNASLLKRILHADTEKKINLDPLLLAKAVERLNTDTVDALLSYGADIDGVTQVRFRRICYEREIHQLKQLTDFFKYHHYFQEDVSEKTSLITMKLVLSGAMLHPLSLRRINEINLPENVHFLLEQELLWAQEESDSDKIQPLSGFGYERAEEHPFVKAVLKNNLTQAQERFFLPQEEERALRAYRDRAGRTLLHRVAGLGFAKMAGFLATRGFGVNEPDSDGHTPLYFANEYGNEAVCRALDENGAERTILYNGDVVNQVENKNGFYHKAYPEPDEALMWQRYASMPLLRLKESLTTEAGLRQLCRSNALLTVAERLTHQERMRLRITLFRHHLGSKEQLKTLDNFICKHKNASPVAQKQRRVRERS